MIDQKVVYEGADQSSVQDDLSPTLLRDLVNSFGRFISRRVPAPRDFRPTPRTFVTPRVLNGGYSEVYDPPKQGEFTTRPSRVPINYSIDMQHYFAVQRDEFLYYMDLEPQGATVPDKQMQPWTERTNIARPPAIAYGNMVIMQPNDPNLTFRKGY